MRSALLLIFLILSGCQSVIDKNQTLASLKSKSVNTIQYSQEDDLWQVIANRQGIKSVSNSRVQSRIDWISNHPEYLSLISKRAEPFLYLVVSELEKQNVPIEIALLPIVNLITIHFHILMERQQGYGNLYLLLGECMA